MVDSFGRSFIVGTFNSQLSNLGDAGVLALDATGQILWKHEVEGSDPSGPDSFSAIALAADGDVLVGGRVFDANVGSRFLTSRYAPDGTLEWDDLFDPGLSVGASNAVAEGAGGIVWVAGLASDGVNLGAAAVRYDGVGNRLSSELVTFESGQVGNVELVVGNAGQAYLAGFLFDVDPFELYVAQIDAAGASSWQTSFVAPGTPGSDFRSLSSAPDGRVVVTGGAGNAFDSDFLTVQIDLRQSPQAYCTAKLNSLGCVPWANFTGLSSASASGGFEVGTDLVLNNKLGLFAYSVTGPAALPFGGGLLCVGAPIRRTPAQSSGGNAGVNDCSGRFAIDWNAFAQGLLGGAPDPALLVPGTAVYCQSWGRDPGLPVPNNIQLSNAIRFEVLP